MTSGFVASKPCLSSSLSTRASVPLRGLSSRNPQSAVRIRRSGRFLCAVSDSDTAPTEEILDPSYGLPIAFLGIAAALAAAGGGGGKFAAFPMGIIGAFLTVQTTLVRFVFTDSGLDVAKRSGGDSFETVRGWKYEDFTNWELWWPGVPILCYFKEKGSYEGRGSIHFFPVVFNGNQLLRCLQTKTGIHKEEYPTPPTKD